MAVQSGCRLSMTLFAGLPRQDLISRPDRFRPNGIVGGKRKQQALILSEVVQDGRHDSLGVGLSLKFGRTQTREREKSAQSLYVLGEKCQRC